MPDISETVSLLLTVFAGIGLASAGGIRAFVPLLVLSLAVHMGQAELMEPLAWLGSSAASIVLSILVFVELVLRHTQRSFPGRRASSVLAIASGALVTTALLVDVHSTLVIAAACVAGALIALFVQWPTSALRAAAHRIGAEGATGGLGTPKGETASAILISMLSLYAPIAAPMLVVAVVAGALHMRRQQAGRPNVV